MGEEMVMKTKGICGFFNVIVEEPLLRVGIRLSRAEKSHAVVIFMIC
jgi:hypothetical protein